MKRIVDHDLENVSGEGFPEPLRVSPDELHLAAGIFCFVHRECDATFACQREDTVELRCGVCKVSRTYAASKPDFAPPIETRPLFREPMKREPEPSPKSSPEGMAFSKAVSGFRRKTSRGTIDGNSD